MTDQPGPVRRLWIACLLILGSCVMLWLAVQIVVQIWPWLLGIALLIGIVIWLRWRSQRWR